MSDLSAARHVQRWLLDARARVRPAAPLLVFAAAGLIAAQLESVVALEPAPADALETGVRTGLALWLGTVAVQTVRAMALGRSGGQSSRSGGALAGSPVATLLLAMALLAAALQRVPARLVVNVLGFLLLAAPALWLVWWRAGSQAAQRVVFALGVFAFFPTHLNLPRPPAVIPVQTDQGSFWAVGWPGEDWVLRHEVEVGRPSVTGAWEVFIPFAAPYTGPGRIFATVNGVDLGAAAQGTTSATVQIPSGLVAGQTRIRLDLTLHPADPGFQLLAHRFAQGASLGSDASAYFDGREWHRGTLNVREGRPQPGVYLLRFGPKLAPA